MWEWLLGWWDSLESVTRFRWWMSFLAILVPPLLGSILGSIAWWSGNRLDHLKEKLADPWRLSPQQREQFVAILREAPFKIKIDVPIGDEYGQNFAAELGTLFVNAGWARSFDSSRSVFESPLYGIKLELDLYLEIDDNQEMGRLEMSIIERAFKAVGISLEPTEVYREVHPNISHEYKMITLHVGHRPPPPK
jgi:hypothetical protein